jgi:hypothetical protein
MTGTRSVTAIGTVVLIAACGEPATIQSEHADAELLSRTNRLALNTELLSHTPRRNPSAALLVSPPDYAQLDDAAVQGSGGSIHLSVNTAGEIPRHPDSFISSVPVFGYAWADLDTGKGIVAVIHPAIGRDSKQNPDGWHTHPVQLAAGTTGSGGTSDFCVVSIGRSQAGIAVHNDLMRTSIALRWAGVGGGALDVAASFLVQLDAGCSGSGLGVAILAAVGL